MTREMLLEQVWGDSAYRDPRTIDVHIRHLREKLERDSRRPEYLLTVPRRGLQVSEPGRWTLGRNPAASSFRFFFFFFFFASGATPGHGGG